MRQQQLLGVDAGEDLAIAAQLGGDHDDRRQHGDIDQQILDHRDQGGAAQARWYRCKAASTTKATISGTDTVPSSGSGDGPVQAQRRDHHLHAHQLQRDIGHGGDDAGDRDRQRQAAMAEAAAHEIGGGDIAVACAPPTTGAERP